jgi:osmotically-inducible protein OsmY
MNRTDQEIQQAVLEQLRWDTRVEETDVGVEVDDGIVTLTGTVSSWAKRVAAQEAAHEVAGVLDVANDIEVRPAGAIGRTDTEIAAAVRHALEWDLFVPHDRIRSTVYEGWVMLEGNVDNWNQKEDAERAVRNLLGVLGVTNKIEILPQQMLASEIKKSIEDTLARQMARETAGIHVDVREDNVVLSGRVNTLAERRAILRAAKGTPGVRAVDDRLRVEPSAA